MPVSVVKGKTTAADKTDSVEPVEQVVDELGEKQEEADAINAQIKALQANPIFAECKALKEKLQDLANDTVGPGEELMLSGGEFSVDIGPCAKKRAIIDPTVVSDELEDVEENLSYKLAKYNLSDLDKYLTPPQLDKCVSTERTKKRNVKVIRHSEDW